MYLSKNTLSSLKPALASLLAAINDSFKDVSEGTTRIPFPPPPAAALIKRG